MFTSSLSVGEILMEAYQGSNSVLSLRVTSAAWFNGTVCQKAEQQSVNQQAAVTHTCKCVHTVKKHNGDKLSKTLSHASTFSPVLTSALRHAKSKRKKHICPKRFWQELRQAEMNRDALRAHSQKSAVRKTHITGSPPTKRGDECQEYARCIKRHRCYQSGSQEIPPNKVLLSSLQKWRRGNQPKQM